MSEDNEQHAVFRPEVSNNYRVMDILLRNPTRCPTLKVCEAVNITEAAFHSTVGRLRKKGKYRFKLFNKMVSTSVGNRTPNEQDILDNITEGKNSIETQTEESIQADNQSPPEKVLNRQELQAGLYQNTVQLLTVNPDGLKTQEIIETLKISEQQLYNLAYSLRKKGYNIVFSNGLYTLKEGVPVIATAKGKKKKREKSNYKYKYDKDKSIVKPVQQSTGSIRLIPPEYRQKFKLLPEADKIEAINKLKKSLYYKQSAMLLMDTNELAFKLMEEIAEGI